MWLFDLVDLVTGPVAVPLLLISIIALAIGCIVAPHKSDAARRASIAAGIHPLWLLVPFGGLFLTSPLGADTIGLEFLSRVLAEMPRTIWQVLQAGLAIAQVGLSVHIARRHRAWPWFAWPFTVALALMAGAIVVTDLAMMGGPMVK